MAPLAPNNTARVWVDYHDGFNQHSLMGRFDENEATGVECLTDMGALFTAMSDILCQITILGARECPKDSDVSFAANWPGDLSYGEGTMNAWQAPREVRFVGRSGTGRRVSFSFYGFLGDTPGNYRIPALGSAPITNTIIAINSAVAEGKLRTIDLSNQQMKPYADVNFNSYWERKARS